MSIHIYRSIVEPIRESISQDERWNQSDNGLIWAWECGRRLVLRRPCMAVLARNNRLPKLVWRRGSWLYLAMLQGILGQDLSIFPERELVLKRVIRGKERNHILRTVKFPKDGFPPDYLARLRREKRMGDILKWK